MTRLSYVVSIVGGHFAAGRRGLGILFLVLLALAPLAALVIVGFWSADMVMRGEATRYIAGVYLFLAAVISILSVFTAIWIASQQVVRRKWETILASSLAWIFLAVGTLTMVIVPLGVTEQRQPAASYSGAAPQSSRTYKPMGTPDGSVVIQGAVERHGERVANRELRLLFNDGYASPALSTSARGEFSYRLPSGKWRFVGPLLGMTGDTAVRYELSAPFDPMTRAIEVKSGPPDQTANLLVIVD